MAKHKLISIDLAKNVFQICHINNRNKVTVNKSLRRHQLNAYIAKQESTTIAMEACYSSHYWARCFESMGHKVVLIPAQFVKPFVRGNKSDYNDAIAIAEAAQRPNLQSVEVKTIEQQDIQALHRIRERLVRNRTSLMNQTRGLLSEYGVIAPLGLKSFERMLNELIDPSNTVVSRVFKCQIAKIIDEYCDLCDRLEELEKQMKLIADNNPICQLLMSIPGIGLINATALYSAIGNGSRFKHARELSVWIGLTPSQSSSGERKVSGAITKRGNRYLRKQLVHGARSLVIRSKNKEDKLSVWANAIVQRRGHAKAYVAMANKLARIIWAVLHHNTVYEAKA